MSIAYGQQIGAREKCFRKITFACDLCFPVINFFLLVKTDEKGVFMLQVSK